MALVVGLLRKEPFLRLPFSALILPGLSHDKYRKFQIEKKCVRQTVIWLNMPPLPIQLRSILPKYNYINLSSQ